MLGCYDFCGYYEWTFDWLERLGGEALLADYWAQSVSRDSNRDLAELFREEGFDGMAKYWAHTLEEESPSRGYTLKQTSESFRIDMHDCPSKGFLIRNGLESYRDYCDHCIGWIGTTMKDAGFVIDHEHNHRGQCWWEMHREGTTLSEGDTGVNDVRRMPGWSSDPTTPIDRFINATERNHKQAADSNSAE
jgi:hypothetical protein